MLRPNDRNKDNGKQAHDAEKDTGNGHTHEPQQRLDTRDRDLHLPPFPPMSEAGELFRHRKSRRPGWYRAMTQQVAALHRDTTPRERATWFIAPLVTVGIFLLLQTGTLIFFLGRMSVTVERHERDLVTVREVEKENAALRASYEALRDRYYNINEYVGLMVIYEAGLREKLLPITQRYGIELPPMPQRPPEAPLE